MNLFRHIITVVCVVASFVANAGEPLPAEAKSTAKATDADLQTLQGTWEGVMVGQEKDGKITVTITGDSLHFHRDKDFWFKTTITLPAGKDPRQFHATIKECPTAGSIGEVVVAIFKIEEGTLTLATGNGDGEAPESFETGGNRYELRKVQPQKKMSGSGLGSLVLEGPELHASLKTRQLDAVRHVPRPVVPANPHHSTDADFIEAIARSGSQGSLGREGIRSALFALYLGETEIGFYGLEAASEEGAKRREEALRRIWSHMEKIGRAQIHREGLVIVVVWNDGVSSECWKAVNAKVVERLARSNAGEQPTASPLPAAEPRTLPGLGLTLMPIPAGTFTMGSLERNERDTPPTLVTISQPFWLGRTEVTQGQWKALMDTDVVEQVRRQLAEDRTAGKQRSYREGDRSKVTTPAELVRDTADDAPMYWVSWEEAVAFCRRLTERERAEGRVPGGYEYRLPTDAEWGYAAQADTTTMTGADGTEIKETATAPVPDPITWYRGDNDEGLTGKATDSSAPEKQFPGASRGPGPRPPNVRTPGGFTTCAAISGSGAGTGIRLNCRAAACRIRRAPLSGSLLTRAARGVSSAAASASGNCRVSAKAASVSVWPSRPGSAGRAALLRRFSLKRRMPNHPKASNRDWLIPILITALFVCAWLHLPAGMTQGAASDAFQPFGRTVGRCQTTRGALATLIETCRVQDRTAYIYVSNLMERNALGTIAPAMSAGPSVIEGHGSGNVPRYDRS